ncbi:hypothetical protein V1478_002895, partial [Vespula squamosa]
MRNRARRGSKYEYHGLESFRSSLLCSLLENAIVASAGPNLCQVDRVSPARLRIKSNVRELSIPRNGPTFSSLCAVYTDTSRVCAMDSALSSRLQYFWSGTTTRVRSKQESRFTGYDKIRLFEFDYGSPFAT